MIKRFVELCFLIQILPSPLPATDVTEYQELHIGVIDHGGKFRNVFEFAFDYLDSNDDILPDVRVVELYRSVDAKALTISKTVLDLLRVGVSAIICHAPSYTTEQVANIANQKQVPVIATTATDPMLKNQKIRPYLLMISPSDVQQSKALSDILAYYNWRHFSILTSYDQYGLHGVAGVQRAASSFNWNIKTIQHFLVPENVSALNVQTEIELLDQSESRIMVLNCGASAAGQVLKQAEQFGITGTGYAWLVTDGVTGEFHELNPTRAYSPYLDGLLGTIATTKDGDLYIWFTDEYSTRYETKRRDIPPFSRLAFDSVLVTATALHNFLRDGRGLEETSMDALEDPIVMFEHGPELFNYLKAVEVNGATKFISFHEDGSVKDAKYDILNFDANHGYFKEVGYWLPDSGVHINDEVYFSGGTRVVPSAFIENLEGRHLILGIDVDPPFIIHEEGCGTHNECYSGYCIALVKELSDMLGFTYEFVTPGDGTWGGLEPDGKTWTGIFRDLIDGRIDIATVHMSINSIRETAIDFSVPFMQAGLTVVVRGKEETNNGYFFLSPFTSDVLYAIGGGVIAVVVIVWIYSRISPNGLYWSKQFALMSCQCGECKKRRQDKRHFRKHNTCSAKKLEAADELFTRLNLGNTSWIVFASLLNQDPVENWPTSIPGRIVLLFWWLVVMVILAMYTANLAAFLTITKMTTGLSKIEDLLGQDYYQWGTVKDTHPEVALSNSVREDFQDIIRKQSPVATTDEGFTRALQQNYAFIYESPIFEYMKRKNCSLEKVGTGEFLSFDYAFGFPTDSPYIDVINRALLKLQETSKLDTLWSSILQNTGQCQDKHPSAQLALSSLNGLFTTLAVGLLLSVVALAGEYLYVAWCDVAGKTVGCNVQRPKSMTEALRRRFRYLYHDLKRSFLCKKDSDNNIDFSGHYSVEGECKMDPKHHKRYKRVGNGSTHSDNVFVHSDSPVAVDTDMMPVVDGLSDEEMNNQVREECLHCGHLTHSSATFIP